MVEIVKPFQEKEVSVENNNIAEASEAFSKLAGILEKLRQLLDHEIDMNRVASKEVKRFAFFKVVVFSPRLYRTSVGRSSRRSRRMQFSKKTRTVRRPRC